MFVEMKNIDIKAVIRKTSKPYGETKNRALDGFNIRVSGTIEYTHNGKSYLVGPGEFIFLPRGKTYSYKVVSDEPSTCIIINVHSDFSQNEIKKYSLDDFKNAHFMMHDFSELWNFGGLADRYTCLAHMYSLLSYICNRENLRYDQKKKFHIIEPAVDYLKKNIYSLSLKIEELHTLCHVSDTYFRKIFISRFGMSPKKYVIEKRMEYAKSIIDSGEFTTVKQLSLSVGYTDALYFGKMFKKRYGISPLAMNVLGQNQ